MSLHPDVLARAERRVGTTVRGKYTLDALLGVGGAGAVFAATHRNGTRVALKMLHPELAKRTDLRARFLREGYLANKIKHEGIVRIVDDDYDEQAGTVFLVMDLLDGESLEAKWERAGRRLPLAAAIAHADAVLDVLAAAHEAGIVHRDIKPDNVFVTTDGVTKVLDFGIARLLDGSGSTRSGEVFGTPAFMPPEQATGRVREIGARSDVWSVGAVLYSLVTGRHVHETPHVMQQMIFAGTQQAAPIRTQFASAPEGIAAVIDRALAFTPDDRWPSARAMQTALRDACANDPPSDDDAAPATIAEHHGSAIVVAPTLPTTRTLIQGGSAAEEDEAFALERRKT